jgi:hypothetical protein
VGVFAQVENATFAAGSGIARVDSRNQLQLTLRDGVAVKRDGARVGERTAYRVLTLTIPRQGTGPADPVSNGLDERDMTQLMRLVHAAPTLVERNAARAAIHARIGVAAFTAMLPFFGFILGTPPLRASSAFGIFAGLVLVAAFVRASAGIEDSLASVSLAANGLILLVFAGAAILLFRLHRLCGRGFVDRFADRALLRLTPQPKTRRTRAQ